jgi:hypothetical protein
MRGSETNGRNHYLVFSALDFFLYVILSCYHAPEILEFCIALLEYCKILASSLNHRPS